MKIKALQILVLTVMVVRSQNIYRKLSHPLYFLKLGDSRLVSHHHTFISKISLKPIESLLLSHKEQITKRMGMSGFEEEEQLLRLVNQSVNTLNRLKPLKRERRGLFNFVGTIYKDLFGVLDNDDLNNFNNKFQTLIDNQHKITDDLNLKTSLLSKFLQNYNNTINTLVSNQAKISLAIENLKVSTNEILYMEINLNLIQTYLNNLEEAINLSYVHILSKFILPPNDLFLLIKDLEKIYDSTQLLYFKNVQSYYPLIQLTSTINDNLEVIFTIKVPILQQTSFILYHVFPVPISNQTIVPRFPYYLLSLTTYLGVNEECPKQEEIYLCPSTTTIGYKEDCIPEVLQHFESRTCQTIGIEISTPIVQLIDQNKILLVPVPNDSTDVTESCPNSIRHVKLTEPTEISISPNCSVTYDNEIYVNLLYKERFPSVLLPSMDLHSNVTPILKLDNVNLKDISDLYKHANSIKPLKIEDLPEDGLENHIPIITLSIIISIILIILLYCYCKSRKVPFNLNFSVTKRSSQKEDDVTPRSPNQGNVGSHPLTTPSFIP